MRPPKMTRCLRIHTPTYIHHQRTHNTLFAHFTFTLLLPPNATINCILDHDDQLFHIAPSVGLLESLQTFKAPHNDLCEDDVPKGLFKQKFLTTVDLSHNKLTTILDSMDAALGLLVSVSACVCARVHAGVDGLSALACLPWLVL